MKRTVVVRPAADLDLDQQAAYLVNHRDVRTAARFLGAARDTFELLNNHPEMGRVTEYRSRFLAGTRMFPLKGFPKHLVFYRPLESGIEVIRVIHGARDIETLFEE